VFDDWALESLWFAVCHDVYSAGTVCGQGFVPWQFRATPLERKTGSSSKSSSRNSSRSPDRGSKKKEKSPSKSKS
jgi:hypothetical protein